LVLDGSPAEVVPLYLQMAANRGKNSQEVAAHRVNGSAAVIRDVALLDGCGRRGDLFLAGDDFTVEIDYEAPAPLRNNPRFGVQVEAITGEKLFFLQSRIQHGMVSELPRAGRVRCRVPSLPLVPGIYCLTINCTTNEGRVDLLERVATFTVEAADFFGTGDLPAAASGKVLVRARWELPQPEACPAG
jgi:lipopolysaccharide transport system ATP-binding protein